MSAYLTCPTCDYFQLRAQRCCECRATLDYRQADVPVWDVAALTRLLDAIDAIPVESNRIGA